MRVLLAFSAAMGLWSCSEPEVRDDPRSGQEINAAIAPPPKTIVLDTITTFDIRKNSLSESGCRFSRVADDAGKMLALVGSDAGYLKIDGKMVRFASDVGSSELPHGAYSKYDGLAQSLLVEAVTIDDISTGPGSTGFPAQLSVSNERGQIAYEIEGVMNCAP